VIHESGIRNNQGKPPCPFGAQQAMKILQLIFKVNSMLHLEHNKIWK